MLTRLAPGAFGFRARVRGERELHGGFDEVTSVGRKHLAALHKKFTAIKDWESRSLEEATRAYVEESGAKLGNVAQPLRAALTGRAVSPPVFDVLYVLGRNESLARIAEQAGGAVA